MSVNYRDRVIPSPLVLVLYHVNLIKPGFSAMGRKK